MTLAIVALCTIVGFFLDGFYGLLAYGFAGFVIMWAGNAVLMMLSERKSRKP